MQVMLGPSPFFIHQAYARLETVQPVFRGRGVMLVGGEKMRERIARARNCLEAAIAPATIEIEPLDMGLVDDR